MRDYKQLQYLADFNATSEIVLKWLDAKPDNKELQLISRALFNMSIYVSSLELERRGFDMTYQDTRDKLLEALKTIKELESELPTEADKKFTALTTSDNNAINSIL